MKPRQQADMHRSWSGSAGQLSNICALHHQRQVSAQLSCRYEGQVLQIEPGQTQSPKARALVDIAQHRDGRLELSDRGHALRFKRYACSDHLGRPKLADAKTLDQRVDRLASKERKRLASLAASIAHQDSQRNAGIYATDSPANAPRAAVAGHFGLRPAQPATAAP